MDESYIDTLNENISTLLGLLVLLKVKLSVLNVILVNF